VGKRFIGSKFRNFNFALLTLHCHVGMQLAINTCVSSMLRVRGGWDDVI